jgi:AraC-like DNA-binding protein
MTTDDLDFKRVHFKSPDIFDRNWLEWFLDEFARHQANVETDFSPDNPIALEGISRVLPDLSIYLGTCSPSQSRNILPRSKDDDPALIIALSDGMTMEMKGGDIALKPGQPLLVANDTFAIQKVHSTTQFISIRLRRNMMAPLVRNLPDMIGATLPGNSQIQRLLLGYVQMLGNEEKIADAPTQQLVTAHIHEMVALLVGDASGTAAMATGNSSVRAARFAAIKADIQAYLVLPDLSIASVAARQGVTPRYIQMLFEAEGMTYSEYVLGQRLVRAHRMLTDPRFAPQTIGAIAYACGFSDLSYFNRTFRRAYGMTPSELRATARR